VQKPDGADADHYQQEGFQQLQRSDEDEKE
jgi:hypothetical protein